MRVCAWPKDSCFAAVLNPWHFLKLTTTICCSYPERKIDCLAFVWRDKLQFERGQTLHLILCILLVVSLLRSPLGAGRGKLKLYYSCTSQLLFCPSKIYQHCNSRQCWSESWRSVMCRGTRLFISQQNGVSLTLLLWYDVLHIFSREW